MRWRIGLGIALCAVVSCGGRTKLESGGGGDAHADGTGGSDVGRPQASGGAEVGSGGDAQQSGGASSGVNTGGSVTAGGSGASSPRGPGGVAGYADSPGDAGTAGSTGAAGAAGSVAVAGAGGFAGTAGTAGRELDPFVVTGCIEGGFASSESLSHDGRWFVLQRGGISAVATAVLVDRSSGEQNTLHTYDTTAVHPPFISGDATRMTWSEGVGNASQLRVVEIATGESVGLWPIGDALRGALSDDGRFLAYSTRGPAGTDPEPQWQGGIVVRNLETDEAWLASVPNDGTEANDYSLVPDLSDDGRFTVFQSVATNLVPGKPRRRWDAYLHDRATGETRLAAPNEDGDYLNRRTWYPRIAADGSVVAVIALATEADEEPSVDHDDACLYTPFGEALGCFAQGSTESLDLKGISADGRFVLLSGNDDVGAPGDTNDERNAIVYDRALDRFELVGHDDTAQFADFSVAQSLSGDGRVVAFSTMRTRDSADVICFAERGGVPAGGAGGAGGAGAGGAGGALVDADFVGLFGHYTLAFASLPEIDSCYTRVDSWDAPLDIALPAGGQVDILLRHYQFQTLPLALHELVVGEERDYHGSVAFPEVTLAVASGTLTGSGVARVPYECTDGTTVVREVAVAVIREDSTPLVVPDYSFPGPAVPVGGLFTMRSTRALYYPDGEETILATAVPFPRQGPELVAAVDATTGEPLPVLWQGWPWGGSAAALAFDEPPPAPGTVVGFELLQPLTSYIGTEAAMSDRTFTILDSGELTSSIDFDAGPHPGAHGAATYYPPDATDSPCEAGGCLALDGPIRRCDDWLEQGPSSTFAMRLAIPNSDQRIAYRIRYLSTADFAPRLWWWEATACAPEENLRQTDLTALAAPDGVYTYASEWLDVANGPLCMGPREDLSYVFAPGCSDEDPAPEVRIVIEWVQVVTG